MHADDAPVPVNMYTFGNLVRLLSGKKRGEYPTTMQTAGKDAAIIGDLKILSDQGGPSFNNRKDQGAFQQRKDQGAFSRQAFALWTFDFAY